jgi:hypothetical protein
MPIDPQQPLIPQLGRLANLIAGVVNDHDAEQYVEIAEAFLPSFRGPAAEAMNPREFRAQGIASIGLCRLEYCRRHPWLADAYDEREDFAEAERLFEGCPKTPALDHNRRYTLTLHARAELRRARLDEAFMILRDAALVVGRLDPARAHFAAYVDLIGVASADVPDDEALERTLESFVSGSLGCRPTFVTAIERSLAFDDANGERNPVFVLLLRRLAERVGRATNLAKLDALLADAFHRAIRHNQIPPALRADVLSLLERVIETAMQTGQAPDIADQGRHLVMLLGLDDPARAFARWRALLRHIPTSDAWRRAGLTVAMGTVALAQPSRARDEDLLALREVLADSEDTWPADEHQNDSVHASMMCHRLERALLGSSGNDPTAVWGRSTAERLRHLERGIIAALAARKDWFAFFRPAVAAAKGQPGSELVQLARVAKASELQVQARVLDKGDGTVPPGWPREAAAAHEEALSVLAPLLERGDIDPVVFTSARLNGSGAALMLADRREGAERRRLLDASITWSEDAVLVERRLQDTPETPGVRLARLLANVASARALRARDAKEVDPQVPEVAKEAFRAAVARRDASSASVSLLAWGSYLIELGRELPASELEDWMACRRSPVVSAIPGLAGTEIEVRRRLFPTAQREGAPGPTFEVHPSLDGARRELEAIASEVEAAPGPHLAQRLHRVAAAVADSAPRGALPESARSLDARWLRLFALYQLIHLCEDGAAIRISIEDAARDDVPERPEQADLLEAWKRAFLQATATHVSALVREGWRADDSIFGRVDRRLERCLDLVDDPLIKAELLTNRGLLRLQDHFPGGESARGMDAVAHFQAALDDLRPTTDDPAVRTMKAMATMGLANALAMTPTTSGDHRSQILAVALAAAESALDLVSPTDVNLRAKALCVAGSRAVSLHGAVVVGRDEVQRRAISYLGEAEHMTRQGTHGALREIILNNMLALQCDDADWAERVAAIDEEILQHAKDPSIHARAEERVLARAHSGGAPEPDAMEELALRTFAREEYASTWIIASHASREVGSFVRALYLKELALHGAARLATGESRDSGVTEWASRFVITRDHMVVDLALEGHPEKAAALARLWPPAVWRVLLSSRHSGRFPRAPMARDHARTLDQLGPGTRLESLPSIQRESLAAALAEALHDTAPRPWPKPVVRLALGLSGTAFVLEGTPVSMHVARDATAGWLVGLDEGAPVLRQCFDALNGYLASLRTLVSLTERERVSPDPDGDRRVEHERQCRDLIAGAWPAARIALHHLLGHDEGGGYPSSLRLAAMVEQALPNALGRIPGDVRDIPENWLLEAAQAAVGEIARVTARDTVDALRMALGASIEALAEPVSVVPSANLHLYPLELASGSGGRVAMQWSALGDPGEPRFLERTARALLVGWDPGLPQSGDEANKLATMIRAIVLCEVVERRFDDALSKETLLEALRDPMTALWHYAGHSTFDLDGTETGIPLPDGGLLSPLEIAQLDLSHVALVFLSSCMGTLTEPRELGGGFESLATSLLTAGVGHVIGHRWRVGDDTLGAVVEGFYTRWLGNEHPAVALAQAIEEAQETGACGVDEAASWACWTT